MSQNWSAEESNLDRYLIAKLPTEIATGTSTGYNMYQTLLVSFVMDASGTAPSLLAVHQGSQPATSAKKDNLNL